MRRQKIKATETMAMYFAEHGICTLREYKADKNRPIVLRNLKRVLGSWKNIQRRVARMQPELWAEALAHEAKEAKEDSFIPNPTPTKEKSTFKDALAAAKNTLGDHEDS